MSQTETHIGKLKLVPKLENENLEEQCKRILNNKPLDKYYDSYCEMFKASGLYGYKSGYVISNKSEIYEVIEDFVFEGDDIFNANKNSDGTITYVTSFYNGGCGFSDALQECLNCMEE